MPSLATWLDLARSGVKTEASLPDGRPGPLPAHAGAWLDRALIRHDASKKEKKHAGRQLLLDVACDSLRLDAPGVMAYRERFAYLRAEAALRESGTRRVFEVEATSRIHLHPATGATVTEGSLLLHHTYGVPYLPGSALKGVCRARARRLEERGFSPLGTAGTRPWSDDLFGFVTENEAGGAAGLCDFWDALWVPEPPTAPPEADRPPWSPLALDVVTPHHAAYYTQGAEPLDREEPVPTQFLTVRPGARFLVVVEASPAASNVLSWLVDQLLVPALAEDGVGAHTRAGYGRLEPVPGAGGSGGTGRGAIPTAISSGAAARGGLTDTTEETEVGEVSFDRGRRALLAVLPGGLRAEVEGPDAVRIRDSLSEPIRNRLGRGRTVRLRVTFARVGRGRRITGVAE